MQLNARQPDGATLREHLLAAAQATGRTDERLQLRCPPEGRQLVQVWAELSASRPAGLGGASGIPPSEILAWQRLHNVPLSPWEVQTLQEMDAAALAASRRPGGDA